MALDARRLTAPILRLPDELIVEIAVAAHFDWNANPPPDDSPGDTEPPQWIMSHVCRRLHQAVVNASALSTSNGLRRARSTSRCLPQSLRALNHDCVARIVVLHLHFEPRQAFETMLNLFRDVEAPSLKYLDIRSGLEGTDDPVIDFSVLCAPGLVELQLTGCICGPRISASLLSSLVYLRLLSSAALHNMDLWAFLFNRDPSTRVLQSLTSPHLEWSGAIEFTGRFDRTIVSHSLTHLSLEFYSRAEDAVLDTLSALTMPALTHLVIHVPSLKWLAFANIRVDCVGNHDYRPIIRPLRELAKLSILILLKQCFTANILSELFGRGSEPCPFLDTLAVWPLDSEIDEVYEALQEIVRGKRGCSPAEPVPLLVLSPQLYERAFWEEEKVGVGKLKDLAEFEEIVLYNFSSC
ncbi:hypothetical protein FB45DRAFT_1129516 [Roridomyces roridus]|uniref:F-box domain-containing protein n=1 Tax=Roridomyces roridus TaxID=1738132 RepID=A0AAD7FAH9_9AGAR|nr:hypothetical protein FB45DRAFT_1129516 [Roridomyces roridus]